MSKKNSNNIKKSTVSSGNKFSDDSVINEMDVLPSTKSIKIPIKFNVDFDPLIGYVNSEVTLAMSPDSTGLFTIGNNVDKYTGISKEETKKAVESGMETPDDAVIYGMCNVMNNGDDIFFWTNGTRLAGAADKVGVLSGINELLTHECLHLTRTILNKHILTNKGIVKWAESDWLSIGDQDDDIQEESFATALGLVSEQVTPEFIKMASDYIPELSDKLPIAQDGLDFQSRLNQYLKPSTFNPNIKAASSAPSNLALGFKSGPFTQSTSISNDRKLAPFKEFTFASDNPINSQLSLNTGLNYKDRYGFKGGINYANTTAKNDPTSRFNLGYDKDGITGDLSYTLNNLNPNLTASAGYRGKGVSADFKVSKDKYDVTYDRTGKPIKTLNVNPNFNTNLAYERDGITGKLGFTGSKVNPRYTLGAEYDKYGVIADFLATKEKEKPFTYDANLGYRKDGFSTGLGFSGNKANPNYTYNVKYEPEKQGFTTDANLEFTKDNIDATTGLGYKNKNINTGITYKTAIDRESEDQRNSLGAKFGYRGKNFNTDINYERQFATEENPASNKVGVNVGYNKNGFGVNLGASYRNLSEAEKEIIDRNLKVSPFEFKAGVTYKPVRKQKLPLRDFKFGKENEKIELSKKRFGGQHIYHDLFQNGGINEDAMRGMMKARMALDSHFGNPSARRMTSLSPKEYTFTGNEYDYDWNQAVGVPAGEKGTHFMAAMDKYAVPFIQQDNAGNLYFNEKASTKDREAMKFETPEEAQYFSEHYKEIAPMMKGYKTGGIVINESDILPIAQKSLYIPPTSQDSLNVYNKSKELQDYFKNKGYESQGTTKLPYDDSNIFKRELDRLYGQFTNQQSTNYPTSTGGSTSSKLDPKYYRKPINPNKPTIIEQRESQFGTLDTRAPFGYYDTRIVPKEMSSYKNVNMRDPLRGDEVNIPIYDVSVKPYAMRTPAEQAYVEKKYGKPKPVIKPVYKDQQEADYAKSYKGQAETKPSPDYSKYLNLTQQDVLDKYSFDEYSKAFGLDPVSTRSMINKSIRWDQIDNLGEFDREKFLTKKLYDYMQNNPPKAQTGLYPEPTRSDSLFLLNNNKIINDYVNKGYVFTKKEPVIDLNWTNKFPQLLKHQKELIKKEIDYNKNFGPLRSDNYNSKKGNYEDYDKSNGLFWGTTDYMIAGGEDKDFPIQYIHPMIKPQFKTDLVNPNTNSSVYSYGYDDLAITPTNMLTREELRLRNKLYNSDGSRKNNYDDLIKEKEIIPVTDNRNVTKKYFEELDPYKKQTYIDYLRSGILDAKEVENIEPYDIQRKADAWKKNSIVKAQKGYRSSVIQPTLNYQRKYGLTEAEKNKILKEAEQSKYKLVKPNGFMTKNPNWYNNLDLLEENIAEFFDPTGFSSHDDAVRAYNEYKKSDNTLPSINQALDMFGAVPALGKLGKLKYIANLSDIQNQSPYAKKFIKPIYKYFPWQQVLNFNDTVEDIDSDNVRSTKQSGGFVHESNVIKAQTGRYVNIDGKTYNTASPEYKQLYKEGISSIDTEGVPTYYVPEEAIVTAKKINPIEEAVRKGRGKFVTGVAQGAGAIGLGIGEMMNTPLALATEALSSRNNYRSALPNMERVLSNVGVKGYDYKGNDQLTPGALVSDNPYVQMAIDIPVDIVTGKVITKSPKLLNSLNQNLNSLDKYFFTKRYPLKHNPIEADKFIRTEGNKLIDILSSEEGVRRLKNQFKKANPELANWELDDLVNNRLKEIKDAVDFNKAKYFDKLKKNIIMDKDDIFPKHNAHFSPYNSLLSDEHDYHRNYLIDTYIDNKKTGLQKFTNQKYRPGSITLGKGLQDNLGVLSHELGHAIQKSGQLPVDLDLLELMKEKDWRDKLWNNFSGSEFRNNLSYFQKAGGREIKNEPYPFLREQREKMIKQGILKDTYDKVTPKKLLQSRMKSIGEGLFDPYRSSAFEGERLLKITPPWKYKELSDIFNQAPAVTGIIGTGAALSQLPQEEKALGGIIHESDIIKAQIGKYIPSWLNPYNYNVTDYSKYKTKDEAYKAARQAGEKEFMWNKNRYSTKMAGTPEEQLKWSGITDERTASKSNIPGANIVKERLEKNLVPYGYKDAIGRVYDAVINNKSRPFVDEDNTRYKLEDVSQERKDAYKLYMNKPQENNTFGISKYRPSVTKEGDTDVYYKINNIASTSGNPNLDDSYINYIYDISQENKGKNTVLSNDIMAHHKIGLGKDDRGEYMSYYDNWDLNPYKITNPITGKEITTNISKPFEIYDRFYFKDYGDGTKKRMYYTDNELQSLSTNKKDKNFDTIALQKELYNRGYKLPNSTKIINEYTGEIIFDGIYGDETKAALEDWQKKNPNKLIGDGNKANQESKYPYNWSSNNQSVPTSKTQYSNKQSGGVINESDVIKYKSGGNHGGLDRWFAEKWVDVKTGKECGRQEGEKRRSYPACRPSVRVTSKTPKTASELSSAEKEKFKRSKTSSQRINYQHKRNNN